MENIVFKPKSKQELDLLKALAEKMGIKYSIEQRPTKQKKIKKKPEGNPAFVPGNPKKAKEAMKQVFGMWANRKDTEDARNT